MIALVFPFLVAVAKLIMMQQLRRVSVLVLPQNLEKKKQPFPVHCLAHSLNLCLQDAGRKVHVIRDSMDLVKEIVKLINYSPKRKELFGSKLLDNKQAGGTITPLCPTRWTAAFDSVIKQYVAITKTLHEVHQTTRDEYGFRAGGVLAAIENVSILFGLRLGHLLFGAAEETSKPLKEKDTSVQEALTTAKLLVLFFKRQRTDSSFESFFATTEALATELKSVRLFFHVTTNYLDD